MSAAKSETDGLHLTKELLAYIRALSAKENPIQKKIRSFTRELPEAVMMIPPEQGQLLSLLARLLGAERIVEVGVFTGYSATWLADSLPPHGKLVACDLEAEWMEIAQGFWDEAKLSDKIEPRLGPGEQSLKNLLSEGWRERVDMIFIDADKTGYDAYYTLGMQLLRPGGLLVFDNVMWSGEVANPENQEESTVALRQILERASEDSENFSAVVTHADGLLLVLKPKP